MANGTAGWMTMLQPLKSPDKPGFLKDSTGLIGLAIPQGIAARYRNTDWLLDFGFLVHHMLAHDWVEFFHLQLAGHGSFVFCRGVKMPCAGGGHHFYFIAHRVCPGLAGGGLKPAPAWLLGLAERHWLDFFAAFSHVAEHRVDAALVDDAHTIGGDSERDKSLFCRHPETVCV